MKNSYVVPLRSVLLFPILSITVAMADESPVRCYPVSDKGRIQLNVPVSWTDQFQQANSYMPPTIFLSQKSGASWKALITPIGSIKKDNCALSADEIRNQVKQSANQAASQAVEKSIDVIELKGVSGSGYYFSATDRAPKPGGFKHLTQGIIPVGELLVSFTILTNEGQQKAVTEVLSVLKSAKYVIADKLTSMTDIPIPGEGWSIEVESPALSEKKESREDGNYVFNAGSERFNLSLFVEQPQGAGKTHEDCYGFYWPQASRNPRIVKVSVVASHSDKYYRVQYDTITEFAGRQVKQKNVNYYFAFQGKWVDVHISITDPTVKDEPVIAAFDKSLSYRKVAPKP